MKKRSLSSGLLIFLKLSILSVSAIQPTKALPLVILPICFDRYCLLSFSANGQSTLGLIKCGLHLFLLYSVVSPQRCFGRWYVLWFYQSSLGLRQPTLPARSINPRKLSRKRASEKGISRRLGKLAWLSVWSIVMLMIPLLSTRVHMPSIHILGYFWHQLTPAFSRATIPFR